MFLWLHVIGITFARIEHVPNYHGQTNTTWHCSKTWLRYQQRTHKISSYTTLYATTTDYASSKVGLPTAASTEQWLSKQLRCLPQNDVSFVDTCSPNGSIAVRKLLIRLIREGQAVWCSALLTWYVKVGQICLRRYSSQSVSDTVCDSEWYYG